MRKLSFQAFLCLILFSLAACVDPIEYFKNVESEQVFTTTDEDISKLHFVDEQTGYGYNKKTIYSTSDGGRTWQVLTKFTNYEIAKLEFPEKGTGYLLGSDTRMYKSVDGGATWSQMNLNTYDDRGVDAMSFANANVGALTDGRMLHITTNGGATWTQREITPGYPEFKDIYIFDKDTMMLFSRNDNKIFYTTDAGKTFNSNRYYSTYQGIIKIDGSTAFMYGGEDIGIIKNNGQTIDYESSPSFVTAGFPINETTWYLSGNYYLFKTRDAGLKYEEFYNEEGATILFNAVWFFDSKNGIGVKDSKVYKLKFLEE